MKVLHISAECYPAAKAGGLGDVLGSLPKYLCNAGVESSVIIPFYHNEWLLSHPGEIVYKGIVELATAHSPFAIRKINADLGFTLYAADIPGRFDRPGVYIDPFSGYGYWDEIERNTTFQKAVLNWLTDAKITPDVLHCHDHHTALIPFMTSRSPQYNHFATVPTVFTIHNGHYQGAFQWSKHFLLPLYHQHDSGMLDWDHHINPMASAIKCAWAVTTVSNGYLQELQQYAYGLESLFRVESGKSHGIVNGIDAQSWNPATDKYLNHHAVDGDIEAFKHANKAAICKEAGFSEDKPLMVFIGRMVDDKGVDIMASALRMVFASNQPMNVVVLGSGDPHFAGMLENLGYEHRDKMKVVLRYDEKLAHNLYAAADFLLMPSRTEPCGLNQLYSMHYGTIPIVRETGGLKETVPDVGQEGGGRGFTFKSTEPGDLAVAIMRAIQFYFHKTEFTALRKHLSEIDFSWENAAKQYIDIYQQLIAKRP